MTRTETRPSRVEAARTRYAGTTFAQRLKNRDLQRIVINIVVIVAIGIFAQIATGHFLLSRNLWGLFVQIGVVAMIAAPVSIVMVAGCIDVSLGGTVVLSGVVSGLLAAHGMALWLSFLIAVLVGVLVGLANSFLILGIGITSLIATIGTLYVTQGIGNILTNGLPVAGVPPSYATVGSGTIGGGSIPIQVPMVLGVLLLFIGIQRYTSLGRYAIATGSNRRGAFLNGVPVRRTITLCFVLSGAAAGWGGVVYGSRIGTPVPVVDQDLLFQVIVACVVGGTSLTGGRGTVFGAFTGAMLIAVVNDTLDLLGVSTFWQYIALGGLLVLAVGFDTGFREMIARRRFSLPDVLDDI
jgi:ribose/xylose/arabinose/galactoside ABC-type transport system permease subunit